MNRSNRSWVVVVAVGLAGCLGETEMVGGPTGSGGGVVDPGPAPGGGEGGGVAQGGGTGTFTGPAKLVMTLEPSVTAASLGQKVVVNVRVSNVGASTAVQVAPRTPLQTGTGRAALKQAPTPASVDLPSGAEHVFTFEYETTDAGAWSLEAYADGLDADLEQAVTAGPVRAEVLIHGAALLTAESLSAPARAMVGESFTVTLVVKNGGQGDAEAVKPTLSFGAAQVTVLSGPTPATASIAAGAQAQFTFSCRVDAAGSVVPHAQAAGIDASSLQPVSTMAIDGAPIDVDSPAKLEADLMLPAAITQGSTFSATLVVRNTGTSAARALVAVPAAPAVTQGAASLQSSPSAAAFDLPGGGSAPLTWTFTATTAGPLTLTIAVQGTDDRTGAAVKSALATSNTAQVGAAPSLQVTALTVPAAVTRGQRFPVGVTVKNTGGAALTAVVPQPLPLQPSVAGGAKATTTTVPAPKDLAPGASATFTFDFLETGTGPGSLTFAAGASAVVAPAGASVTAPTSVPQVVSVQAPADLTVESIALPLRLSRGQAFSASVVVRNNGAAAASQVKLVMPAQVIATGGAGAMAGNAPAAVDLAAGASAAFTLNFTETGTAAGTLKLALTATGTDAVSGAALASPAFTSPTAAVETPAQLVVTSLSLPPSLTRGGAFAVSMTVANQGQATATNVRPALPLTATATGGAAATAGAAPAGVVLAGGASTTFTLPFTESGTAVGSLAFAGKALGTDANAGTALSAAQVSSPVAQVVAPSSLAVTGITLPATLTRGQAFQVVVTVKNSGGSSLSSVLPSPSPLTVLAQGSAGATVTQSPAAQTVAAGATATFTYGYTENGSGAGTLSITAGARGTDSGTGGTVTASAVQSNVATVQVPAVLVVDSVTLPARISRGMRFDATVVVRNGGGSNATNVRLGTLAPTATGGAAATTSSAPAAVTLAPGATTSFTYSYLEAGTGPGTWALTAAAAGTDAATGGALSSPSVTSAALTVQSPAALTATLSAP
ncbi:MAG: hypothetical protein K1X89_06995, partial [Myxococcaceae bacterium]|nr:hypothetical protein [Myxococcaceae bacterium]